MIVVPFALAGLLVLLMVGVHIYYRVKLVDQVVRIFEEKPLFIIPRGDQVPDAEEVSFRAIDGTLLRGCYLPHRGAYRKGVILFGLEFGSNRWASVPYCGKLRDAGYDVFAYEPRNQGESETDTNYRPLQWVTDKDVADARAALNYLKDRHDADPRGVGVFGISKGGSVGLLLAAEDPAVRCVVTDGAFATYSTMVPYMRRWVSIYSPNHRLQKLAPDFMYGSIGLAAMNRVARARKIRFPWVERAVRRVRVPVFMIHGQADTYIKPAMAEALYEKCGSPDKSLWLVPKAKHNQGPQVAATEYFEKLSAFFDAHLARLPDPSDEFGNDLREVLPTPRIAWEDRELAPIPRLAPAK
ncbi:MAG: lysophospholipase [Fimbriiglobus sp.]|nr:lysophospholipase [Fimbriiglobus sp.]